MDPKIAARLFLASVPNKYHVSFFGQWGGEFHNRRSGQWAQQFPLGCFGQWTKTNAMSVFLASGAWNSLIGDSASGPKIPSRLFLASGPNKYHVSVLASGAWNSAIGDSASGPKIPARLFLASGPKTLMAVCLVRFFGATGRVACCGQWPTLAKCEVWVLIGHWPDRPLRPVAYTGIRKRTGSSSVI